MEGLAGMETVMSVVWMGRAALTRWLRMAAPVRLASWEEWLGWNGAAGRPWQGWWGGRRALEVPAG